MRGVWSWVAFGLAVLMVVDLLDILNALDRRVTRLELARAGLSPNGPWGIEKERNDG